MIDFKDIFQKKFIGNLSGKAKVYIVGGAVRDTVMKKEPKDIDIVVCGMPVKEITNHLEKYGYLDLVGESFGVFKFRSFEDESEYDIALPRTDKKKPGEKGHRSIETQSDHTLGIIDDLGRRDLTINAMAIDENNKLIDPFNGLLHIYNNELHAVSNDVFLDDPLRMMRALVSAASLEFEIDFDLKTMINENAHLIKEIKPERVLEEFDKVFRKHGNIDYFVELLDSTGLWEEYFDFPMASQYRMYDNLAGFLFSMASNQENILSMYRNKLSISKALHQKIEAYEIWFKHEETQNNPKAWLGFQALQKSTVIFNYVLDSYPSTPISYGHLKINGDLLLDKGLEGKQIGNAIKKAIIAVATGRKPNERDELLEFVLSDDE